MGERRSLSVLKEKRGYSGTRVHTHPPMTSNLVSALLPEPTPGELFLIFLICGYCSVPAILALASRIRTVSKKKKKKNCFLEVSNFFLSLFFFLSFFFVC